MLEMVIENHAIRFGPRCAVSFQRTLRIPDDGRTYPLPPGLGAFRIHRVDNYKDRLPQEWQTDGGAFITMYQREALWIGFRGAAWKPNAVKIEIGGINALSGRKLEDMEAGARVDIDERKHNPFDFALWKSSKPEEPAWNSPWRNWSSSRVISGRAVRSIPN